MDEEGGDLPDVGDLVHDDDEDKHVRFFYRILFSLSLAYFFLRVADLEYLDLDPQWKCQRSF